MTQQANRAWFFVRLSFVFSLQFWCFRPGQKLEELRSCGNSAICGSGTVCECSGHFPKETNCTRAQCASGWPTTTTVCSAGITLLLQALPPRGTPQWASTPLSLPHSFFFKFLLPYVDDSFEYTCKWTNSQWKFSMEFTTALPYTFLQFSKWQCLQQQQFKKSFYVFIYLATPGLRCKHVLSLVMAGDRSVVPRGV